MPRPDPPTPLIHRAADRFTTEAEGRRTHHAFSFGAHYDPANLGFGPLLAYNDDTVLPGHGYPEHPHSDVEIVTWVLGGGLRHEDSRGHGGLVVPGTAQRLSAGDGVRHTETCDAGASSAVRFVQMWLRPDEPGGEPTYAAHDAGDALATGELVPVAGAGTAAPVGTRGAVLHAARPRAGARLRLPDAPTLHVHVATGAVELEGAGPLTEGDTVRWPGGGGAGVRVLRDDTELLVWTLP
ncbi:pirin family protein [Nocardioides massiliensis]|uniref:Redox-sensitive bicupin YhaK (Pirin superfamily) n=1 Tax=Nocardioides massiliensis TaxID=1325935 RepID=A0ABT9NLU5_9ACTN|nr:pirin family protein [Nocardioides massiliensis]MDP9821398.1 redox-sensitive bicupin YhaK (pirin superfamily) [Nocardioides massiliensis]